MRLASTIPTWTDRMSGLYAKKLNLGRRFDSPCVAVRPDTPIQVCAMSDSVSNGIATWNSASPALTFPALISGL